ncbi:ornithine carbamoyltransferase, partial [Staphylococcus pseudintermedius]
RAAFSVAGHDVGAHVDYYEKGHIHLGVKESIADTEQVSGRMYDGIEFLGYHQSDAKELRHYSGVSLWNVLTNELHPTQLS